MLIKRIKATNFKTYLALDLDLAPGDERPIILIGGANGGGKTTLFEAIHGALYGLHIRSAQHFNELLNAGAAGKAEAKITLELHFSGKVLNEKQQYVLTRTYILNPASQPVESVKLNLNGNTFTYGTATPALQRAEQEAQVAKIIKANLPKELSRYFLFDAMDAGNLLKRDVLAQVIRENIEDVMGFNKYLQLARASESLLQQHTAQRLEVEGEKQEYLKLLDEKKVHESALTAAKERQKTALQYSVANQELYEGLKSGLNQETTLKAKMEQATGQIESIRKKSSAYRASLDSAVSTMELTAFLPRMAESLRSEMQLILRSRKEGEAAGDSVAKPEQVAGIAQLLIQYLREQGTLPEGLTARELVDYVMAAAYSGKDDAYAFLDHSELTALEELLGAKGGNPFPALALQAEELEISSAQIPVLEAQTEAIRQQIAGKDYSLMKTFEDNEAAIKRADGEIATISEAITGIDRRLHQFDINVSQEPDPKYEALQKLKPFFEEAANALLRRKKLQIEMKMKADLNLNLAAYRDVIDRVELSDNLQDLSFKIFHKAGNEIYLNQLNTASKQIVVQVLLKALHEAGDYDPPVMIDTVMGVLDETSRATVLENYFPELSHQTILLSSDSEIRAGGDLAKIAPFVAKAYTLERDREAQLTFVSNGYFGTAVNE